MAADVAAWCRDCQHCCRSKVQTQPRAPVQPIPVPGSRFSVIHVDLVGPLPVSKEGYSHLFTVIDRSTRWAEAIPLSDISATSCADALISGWVSRFGVPGTLVSDRGTQFTSAVWHVLAKRLGFQHCTTTAYHPQSNGLVERFHRQLKTALRARLAGVDWPQHLPWVLLGLRTAPKEDANISSAELVYGAPLTLPGQFLNSVEPPPLDFVDNLRVAPPPPPTRPLSYAEVTRSLPASLEKAAFVYIRRGPPGHPLTQPYQGPYKVVERSLKTFLLEVGGRREVVFVDRIKPHLGTAPVEAASPPRRGRLPLAGPSPASTSSAVPQPPASSLGGGPVEAGNP